MALRIEDYALISDETTVALVGRDGSIDWLCLPEIDSSACFAALLGAPENGRWLIAPRGEVTATSRRYLGPTMILETEFTTEEGRVAVIDFMPIVERGGPQSDLIRIVEGREGAVPMCTDLVVRFGYGRVVPWVQHDGQSMFAIAGSQAVELDSPVQLEGHDLRSTAEFVVEAGARVPFILTHYISYGQKPTPLDAETALRTTEQYWTAWAGRYAGTSRWREPVVRSLLTLKSLIHEPSGGIAAAATCSLPEELGGERNWDYRFCWIRDATLTLYALLGAGYLDEARAWIDWLVRAVAGSPSQLQVMYTVRGERLVGETSLPWLAGYEGSRPVRIGNGAHDQFQLDVPGELFAALHAARQHGLGTPAEAWEIQKVMMEHLAEQWIRPDRSIWEVRGQPQHYTHSKMMAWVAADRAVKAVEQFGLDGPVDEWRALRDAIHATVCDRGFNKERNSFVQTLDGHNLDAALAMMPLVGFLPPDDPRIIGTVRAIARDLDHDGFVLRYRTDESDDGLAGDEGAFLVCSFWLCDALLMIGERDAAIERFEKLLALRNDVGLLAEEYDPRGNRQLGNFPQAFSHVGLVNTAANLADGGTTQRMPG